MDTLISEQMANDVIQLIDKHPNNARIAYQFIRRVVDDPKHEKNGQEHPAVCLIRKDDYWYIGGCEEDLVGHYGQTDPSFWYKAKNKVMKFICRDIFIDYYLDGAADIIRDASYNGKLFEHKKRTNSWSKDCLLYTSPSPRD